MRFHCRRTQHYLWGSCCGTHSWLMQVQPAYLLCVVKQCWSSKLAELIHVSWGLKAALFIPLSRHWRSTGRSSQRKVSHSRDSMLGYPWLGVFFLLGEWFTFVMNQENVKVTEILLSDWFKVSAEVSNFVSLSYSHPRTEGSYSALYVFAYWGLSPLMQQTGSIHPCIFLPLPAPHTPI